jgi:hypothetical protein
LSVSTSTTELASELLAYCLQGRQWPDSLVGQIVSRAISDNPAEAKAASRALFGIVVERLGDLFELRLTEAYVRLFTDVMERARPGISGAYLRDRYQRIRSVRPFTGVDPKRIYVLSRVTLGADVAVTSVLMDALKRRFPAAQIVFVGSRKNWALFENDPRIALFVSAYGRAGTLLERLSSAPVFDSKDAIVVDPDSRLTQLGLLPVCDEDRYYFFESRSYGADSDRTLQSLAREWVERTFGLADAAAYIAPAAVSSDATMTISFGVGDNMEKRIPDPFEARVLQHVVSKTSNVWIDTGTPGRERDQVELVARDLPVNLWRGDYAPFAARIAQSRLYMGYDSAGQHVAAACGVPLVSVFAGFASERMFQRWRPSGPGPIQVVKVTREEPPEVLARTTAAIDSFLT